MYNQPISQQQLARERALYRYLCAFERADFDTMDVILQEAEQDPVLDRMIQEAHEGYLVEEKIQVQEAVREKVQALVLHYLSTGVWEPEEDLGIPPVTLEAVLTQLQRDQTVPAPAQEELVQIGRRLPSTPQPLPETLSVSSITRLFEQLGVRVSRRVQKLFRDKAILLSMGRQQGMAQLAATRRQQRKRQEHESGEGKERSE